MPSKGKNKSEWIECEVCHAYLSSRDFQTHRTETCSSGVSLSSCVTRDKNKASHGLIREGVLYGRLVKENDDSLHIPENVRLQCIYLHPSAMKLCSMYIGGPVVEQHTHVVYTVWPKYTLPLTAAGVGDKLYKELSAESLIVALKPLPTPYMAAAYITLSCISSTDKILMDDFCLGYIKNYFEGQFLKKGSTFSIPYYGKMLRLRVDCMQSTEQNSPATADLTADLASQVEAMSLQNESYMKVTIDTAFSCVHQESSVQHSKNMKPAITFDNIGGLDKEKTLLKKMVDVVLAVSTVSTCKIAGLNLPRGLLLYGLSGTGKSMLVQAVAHYADVHTTIVKGSDIWSKYYGETEGNLLKLFEEAESRSPSIVIMDDIDLLCPRRPSNSETQRRIVATIIGQLDQLLQGSCQVLVLATTNSIDQVDPTLRRSGRLDREVEVPAPSSVDRKQILSKCLSSMKHCVTEEEISSLALKAHGYVGADLAALCREGMVDAISNETPELCLSYNNLHQALKHIKPSAMREILLEVPQVTWNDIGGQDSLKRKLEKAIEWPIKYLKDFQLLGAKSPRGILMYGPPGCSKTMVAKAMANESGLNFISIKGPELFSKWVGESERAVREVFRRARSAAPAIIFFDEIDALAGERGDSSSGGASNVSDRILAQLLTEMDGVEELHNIIVVAATNRPDRIDNALLRPGRLDQHIYVPLPDKETRKEIFRVKFGKMRTALDVNIDDLVEATEGYSGAEVSEVCETAGLLAVTERLEQKRAIECTYARHFTEALKEVKPRITADMVKKYELYHSAN